MFYIVKSDDTTRTLRIVTYARRGFNNRKEAELALNKTLLDRNRKIEKAYERALEDYENDILQREPLREDYPLWKKATEISV